MNERCLRVLAHGFKFLEGRRSHDGELWMAERAPEKSLPSARPANGV